MEDQKELVVGGYRFDRLSDASEAALEIEKATYFEQRISGRSPENMLAIYDKVLDERIFVTPGRLGISEVSAGEVKGRRN